MRKLDLVEATVLFRRQLGCTLASLAAVAVHEALDRPADAGVRALREMALGLLVVAVGALAAVTAARLARVLGLSDPWRYGFAFFPCLNLVVLAFFGAHLWPAWTAAGETPFFLLLPRRSMEARTASSRAIALPTPSATGGIVTFAVVLACVGALHAGVSVVRALRSPARPGQTTPSGAASPSADTAAYRPFAGQGQAAFDQASAQIVGSAAAGAGLGNTPEATRVAQRISDTMEREVRKSLAAYADFRPVIAAGSPFRVYVYARPERAGVLMHVPRFEGLPDAARLAMMHFGWRAATDEVRSLRLVGARGVALGLRGAGAYGAVTWGELTDDVPGQNAVGPAADTTVLAAFFADARLPLPVPSPRPGSYAERLFRQKGPLRTTEDVEALLRDCEARSLPAPDLQAALFVLGDIALGYDARITPEQERRLAVALRGECAGPPPDTRCPQELRRQWARLDRPFLEETFEARLEEKGPDQDLWWLLIQTRDRADRARWARTLEKLVRVELGRGRGAYDAIHYWLDADPAAAERVVLEELAPRSLAPPARLWLTQAVLSVGLVRGRTDEAGARLSEIAALGGPAAAQARTAREILGLDSQDRIEAMARTWRETRSGKALADFYYAYLEKLPMGTPFARWRERLGAEVTPPGRPASFHVTPVDQGTSLYLEIDAEGRLFAISFD